MKRYRHKKRGTVYQSIGAATVQSSVRAIHEGDTVEVYRAEGDGALWARPTEEFHDGRFEEISPTLIDEGEIGKCFECEAELSVFCPKCNAPTPIDGEAADLATSLNTWADDLLARDASILPGDVQASIKAKGEQLRRAASYISRTAPQTGATEEEVTAALGRNSFWISAEWLISILARTNLNIVKVKP
jgi:hypothetical protein